MKVDFSLYHLQSHDSLNVHTKSTRREGALLKFHFGDGSIGYADCHPWPELGDIPLQAQFNRLKQKSPTTLMQCSIRFAQMDAHARARKKSLLAEKSLPESHCLVTNFLSWTSVDVEKAIEQGYSHFKIKGGRQLDEEALLLLKLFRGRNLKLRVDFNESLKNESFQRFLEKIESIHSLIDYIEDPFPFHAKQWEEVQRQGWSLACDRHAVHANHYPHSASVLIIKPAVQKEADWKSWTKQRRVVSSYLDHPFGQLTAAYSASILDPQAEEVHGLLSHHAYATNSFSQKLAPAGPRFKVPIGEGFGFESDLVKQQWKTLIE